MRSLLEGARRLVHAARGTVGALRTLDGATAHEVCWRSGPARLLFYPPAPAPPDGDGAPAGVAPLLLVTPIINRFRVVDLVRGASLVEGLTAAGIPVYVVDWGAPRRIDGATDWDDYVLRLLPAMARCIAQRERAPRVDLLGYCLGGTIATMFAARVPDRVRRLATLMTPIDFAQSGRPMALMRRWVEPSHFPVGRLTRAFGAMPGALVAQGFVWQQPVAVATKYLHAWPRFSDLDFARRFLALDLWTNHSVNLPGAAYRRLIRDLYRGNRLARGELLLAGRAVRLERITHPLLVITGDQDPTCPPAAATALFPLARSEDASHLSLRGGHVGPVVGGRAAEQLYRPLARWLRGHSAGSPVETVRAAPRVGVDS